MPDRIRAFVPPHTRLGECPLYRPSDNTLHYIDFLRGSIHILDLACPEKGSRRIQCPEEITFMCFHAQRGGYLVCTFKSIAHVSEEGRWSLLKEKVLPADVNVRFNDGAVDSRGRLWLGCIDMDGQKIPIDEYDASKYHPTGSMFRFDPDGTLTVMEKGGMIGGNGFGWSPDEKTMYFTDSHFRTIFQYDFNIESGTISNKRIFVRHGSTIPRIAQPDGLLVDSQNCVYSFLWDGGMVIKYNSDGSEVRRWEINAARVTHGAWVGEDLQDMVLTSALLDDEKPAWDGEEAGGLFLLRDVGAVGLLKYSFGG